MKTKLTFQSMFVQKATRKAMRLTGTLLAMALIACPARGQQSETGASIRYDALTKVFRIDAADTTYAFGVNETGQLQNLYWGKHISQKDHFAEAKAMGGASSFDPPSTTTPQEFIGWGGALYVEPDLKVTFLDGNRDLVLRYVSNQIHEESLSVVMKDISREVYVTLNYQMDGETGILRRSADIENRTEFPLTIEQVAAGTWNLPEGTNYRLHYLSGRWAGEWSLNTQVVGPGKTVLESRRGTTGSQNNPWFAIDRGSGSDEGSGEVWFGALGWSGSWQMSVEQDAMRQVRITAGPNPFDFSYRLEKGHKFETPYFYGGFSDQGLGGASRLLHRFETDSLLPKHPNESLRPVLYNSWEATGFDVNEANQIILAEKAASIGVERFVMDDGWFGGRINDHAGLGDWYANKQKFPHGLKPLINRVHSLGMDFGLWVEPEMVNPDSDLYRAHPDWVLEFPGRPHTLERNQLVLNLARPEVREYVLNSLDSLLTKNDIAFLKWDYNRNWSEPGWSEAPLEKQKNIYVDFTRNFYWVLSELRRRHPSVEIESCSGGGSRVDLGVLRFADEVWPSDNTDAFDRLSIQDGFTYAYSPAIMMAWVTDSPTWVNNRSLSLDYRFLSAMQGSLGIGANLNKWSSADSETATQMIAQYKKIRETVQRGSLYRLISPQKNDQASATESVSRNGTQAVVFSFLHSSQETYPFQRLYLKGLDQDAVYGINPISGHATTSTPTQATGSYWMNHGFDIDLKGDFQAAAFVLTRLP